MVVLRGLKGGGASVGRDRKRKWKKPGVGGTEGKK